MNDREIFRLMSRVSQLESKIRLLEDVVAKLQRRLDENQEIKIQGDPVYPDF